MSIFLNKDSKVIVQGITGGEGTKHTARMLAAGTSIVGGVNARKAGTTVSHTDQSGNAVELPVFATVLAYMVPGSPDSGLSRFLSLFPATSPAAMPARMMTSDVGWFEVGISLLLLAASIVLLRTAAGRIFRMAMLMYGKEPSWAEMRRWIFER